jgi:hypothetical protein
MKRIIVKIGGGLGNQLFTYAAAKRLAISNSAELVIDSISGFENDVQYNRKYMLDFFGLVDRKANVIERLPFNRYFERFFLNISKFKQFKNRRFIFQENINFDGRILEYYFKSNIVYFKGYWQSEMYFKDIESTIRNSFKFNLSIPNNISSLIEQIKLTNSISLHVRFFEDNLNSNYTISEEYYFAAMNYISKKVDSPHFFIFSDNPNLLKNFLIKCNSYSYTLVDLSSSELLNVDMFEFYLMKSCKHKIIANSTFSWWAAWLGEFEKKIVIAPKFESFEGVCAWGFKGLIPDDWILL